MKPLKVTAYMQTGKIATTDLYLPLDSILAEAWMRKHYPERMAGSQSSISPDDFIVPELPLERRGEGDDWYWACSFACGEPRQEEIVYWHKRFDQALGEQYVDFRGRRGKIDTRSGGYKSYRMPLVTYLVPRLEWYAVGDADGIRELLRDVTHIGKKRAQGYGRVARWSVEDYPEDLSHLRALPDSGGEEMGIRPPYWLAWQWRPARLSADSRLAYNWMRRRFR